MFSSAACFILLSLLTALNGAQFRCDYKYFPDAKGWLKLHRIPAVWPEARLRCHLEGGNLVSPLNVNLAKAMKTMINESVSQITGGVFTGMHAMFSKGDYHSVEGVPIRDIPFTWAPGEPDNCMDTESCIAVIKGGVMADVDCYKPLPYICYKKDTNVMFSTLCGTTDSEYTFEPSTGSCYKFHTVPRTWSRAFMTCSAEGGYLVIINSAAEAKVVRDMFAKHPWGDIFGYFWKDVAFVGVHNWNEPGEWLTIDGETLDAAGYSKFSSGEPNNATTGESCGAVYRTALFDDLWCENKSLFICEKKPDSLVKSVLSKS